MAGGGGAAEALPRSGARPTPAAAVLPGLRQPIDSSDADTDVAPPTVTTASIARDRPRDGVKGVTYADWRPEDAHDGREFRPQTREVKVMAESQEPRVLRRRSPRRRSRCTGARRSTTRRPPAFVEQANANDPAILERFSRGQIPRLLQGVRGPADLGRALAHDAGHEQRAVLEVVRRRQAERLATTAWTGTPRPIRTRPRSSSCPSWSPTSTCTISYAELHRQVNEFAALLRDFAGLKAGDRVTLHMPMVPELPVTMLACARLGVIHSQVFGGFSGTACGHRIADSGSRVLITMDGYYRGRPADRSQGQGRRGGRGGAPGGPGGRQGARLAAPPGPVRLADADGRGPGLLRR